ncbi:hypothetical protein R3P38DRAFT_2794603 [Favolaschia claudopus]|uniref:Uncharacterized protein n=1 Tax=Favolaschia claudopus TaxID=2862362 RepID=A0AAW0AA72_9AGAR
MSCTLFEPRDHVNDSKRLVALFSAATVEIEKELGIISAISNFFGQSNLGTAQLAFERTRQGITTGMKSASETRFGTTYIQALAVKLCMPALVACVAAGTITFATKATKRLTPYLTSGAACYGFLAQLDCMRVCASDPDRFSTAQISAKTDTIEEYCHGAFRGRWDLTPVTAHCRDLSSPKATRVALHKPAIAWHLDKLLGDRTKVIEVYNARFDQMMTESLVKGYTSTMHTHFV